MRTLHLFNKFGFRSVAFIAMLILGILANRTSATNIYPVKDNETEKYIELKGKVVDKKTKFPLVYAGLTIVETNISTVSNSEGDSTLKIPKELVNPQIKISYIGYRNRILTLSEIKATDTKIELDPTSIQLPELNVISKDAESLVRAVMSKRGDNYFNLKTLMTAFYRETIRKGRNYVSLSEAVVEINKEPYSSVKSDAIRLFKSRKQTDYTKLDTLVFKLQGGPYSSLNLDVMKNPEEIFTENMLANYEFTFDRSTHEDNRMLYIVNFKQRPTARYPLYLGKLYIDAQTLALKTAVFSLNIDDRDMAADMFILKKPFNATVYPTEAKYRIDYQEKNGKWYFAYSRIELAIKIIWKKKLFNTNYYSTVELAVTDWGKGSEKKSFDFKDRLKPTAIISDEASGFSDANFWGEFNVIEPEKSIETAIKKIQKQLGKNK